MRACLRIAAVVVLVVVASPVLADVVIDNYEFDLGQFAGATVTYRAKADGGQVSFDGKYWDNKVGVDGVTCGELAAGQYGEDPGDQISLNDRSTPDWFQLTYATGQVIGAGHDTFVVYEITSSNSGVDTEGTSWKIKFNGCTLIDASAGTATFLDFSGAGVENVNQIVFDLAALGFQYGDTLLSVYIENTDSGSKTSDPDFIFVALGAETSSIPEPASLLVWCGIGVCAFGFTRRPRRSA